MADEKLAELLKTQKSLTEWLHDINHIDAEAIRREDNDKRERLKILAEIIGLPFDRPVQFDGHDLKNKTSALKAYLQKSGSEVCALRLMPKYEGLPKLRMRGKTVAAAYDWFLEQNIDASKYRADFVPHADATWSLIFIVNGYGVQGEIIRGAHTQLTQGFLDKELPLTFKYDFKKWHTSYEDKEALSYLKKIITYLKVTDTQKQSKLKNQLSATFSKDYLNGYFEAYESDEYGTWFIDYSTILGNIYDQLDIQLDHTAKGSMSGQTGGQGIATGPVQIVDPDNMDVDFAEGNILVCSVTTPNYVPLMQKAAAIVTDQGGILSHAAIVARELKKPCIVGTGNATSVLKNGQIVSVDADLGTVTEI